MAEPVRCDICGKLYSSRHLSSHKRLAHPKHKMGLTSEQQRMQTIIELFDSLSAEHKKRMLAELAVNEQKSS
jgi:predicted nucleic acid binding AN1-type Zn finger protein